MDGRTQVYKMIQCPYDWASIVSSEELSIWLNVTWLYHIQRYEVDHEATRHFTIMDYTVDWESVDELFDVELGPDLYNLKNWASRARADYVSFFRRLAELKNVGPSQYSKHYLTTSSDIEAALSESIKRRVSVLFPWVDSEIQTKILWRSIAEWVAGKFPDNDPDSRWLCAPKIEGLFDVPSARLAVGLPCTIGACGGEESPYCRVELDFNTPQFHMYPITEREFKDQGFEILVKDWDSTL